MTTETTTAIKVGFMVKFMMIIIIIIVIIMMIQGENSILAMANDATEKK